MIFLGFPPYSSSVVFIVCLYICVCVCRFFRYAKDINLHIVYKKTEYQSSLRQVPISARTGIWTQSCLTPKSTYWIFTK